MLIKLNTTRPTLVLNPNPHRKKVTIQRQASAVDPNNTGGIFIGWGFQAVATVGHASQGEILIQGASTERPRAGESIQEKYKKALWLTSDTVNQTVIVEEEVNDDEAIA